MARGRMLNNSVCASKKFHDLPDDTCRLMATWTISMLDVQGVFYGDPAMVKSIIFPRRMDITIEQVAGYLDAMEQVDLIRRFEAKGETWQWWPGFMSNQAGLRVDRETPSHPAPPMMPPLPPAPPIVLNYDEETPSEVLPIDDKQADDCRNEAGNSRESSGNKAGIIPPEYEHEQEVKTSEVKAKKKQRAEPRKKRVLIPAIEVFRLNTQRYPPKILYDDIVAAVGTSEVNLKLWASIVKAYVGNGWNPGNVRNMLEYFKKREIPAPAKNVKQGQALPASDSPHPSRFRKVVLET